MPIPKFAQTLSKRAKAKHKVISGSRAAENIANTKTKKFAKDDMELAKVRKERIKKDVEKIMPKYSKDDMELLKISNKIDKRDFKKMKDSDISKNVTFAEDALNTIKTACDGNSKVTKHVASMIEFVEILKNPSNITMQTLIDVGKEINKMEDELSNMKK